MSAVALLAAPASAQDREAPQFVVATSVSSDDAALARARETMGRMEAAGQLRLVSRFGDRRLQGRVHESFRQVYRGVPVQGGGLTLQRDGGAAVSVLGTLHHDIDVDTTPELSAVEAIARATDLAGATPAGPAVLTVLPSPLGGHSLAWRLVMRDRNVWFIDAMTGEAAGRVSLVDEQEGVAAVGNGFGMHGQHHKVSVTRVPGGVLGETFESRDQLRGAEIVTLDVNGNEMRADELLDPDEVWTTSDVGSDADNDWSQPYIVDTHAHLGLVYDYLRQKQQWNALDGEDGRVMAITGLFGLQNAFWIPPPFGPEGNGALAFGSQLFSDLHFGTLDIVGHEFMHGVTHFSVFRRTGESFGDRHTYVLGRRKISIGDRTYACGDRWNFREGPGGPLACENGRFLLFWNEAGAINEAMSDIVGAATEFAFHPPGDGPLRQDYMSGEDLFAEGSRSLADPGATELASGIVFPDAAARGFRFLVAVVGERLIRYTPIILVGKRPIAVAGEGDYDGVHWNSTILSHSFFLAVEGGLHRSSGTEVTGVGGAQRDRVAQIYFRALTELMPASGTFEAMAAAVRQSAVDLHGAESAEYAAVNQALSAVGLPSS